MYASCTVKVKTRPSSDGQADGQTLGQNPPQSSPAQPPLERAEAEVELWPLNLVPSPTSPHPRTNDRAVSGSRFRAGRESDETLQPAGRSLETPEKLALKRV